MREIPATLITETVSRLCMTSTRILPEDVLTSLQAAHAREVSPLGKRVLGQILANAQIAHQADRNIDAAATEAGVLVAGRQLHESSC